MTHQHPRHALDNMLGSSIRLSIVATLAAAQEVHFGFVRDTVEVSDAVLSKQITQLENVGYVHVTKGYRGKRPRTWLSLTRSGRTAFNAHCTALRAITDLSPSAS